MKKQFRKLADRLFQLPRLVIVILTQLVFYPLYFVTNRNPLYEPFFLPFLPFEENIPLIDWTSYVYLSMYLQAPLLMMLVPRQHFRRALGAVAVMTIAHLAFFVILPTAYPRSGMETGTAVFDFFRRGDSPNNCFPSLHVGVCSLLPAIIWITRGARFALPFAVWSMGIVVSTLTTKQHYSVDIFGSWFVVAIVLYLLPVRDVVRGESRVGFDNALAA